MRSGTSGCGAPPRAAAACRVAGRPLDYNAACTGSAMFHRPLARLSCLGASLALVAGAAAPQLLAQGADKRPSLALKATPQVAFAPAKVVVRAEVKGGPDDFEDFYCAAVEWVWDDG